MSVTQAYTRTASYFHWMTAVPLIGSVGAVLKAQGKVSIESIFFICEKDFVFRSHDLTFFFDVYSISLFFSYS